MDKEHLTGSIRSRFRDLDVALPDNHPDKAYAQYVSAAPVTPLGHFQVTVGVTAVSLPSLPAEARRVILTSIGQPINFRDDTTAPTASTGYPIPADTHFVYDTDPDSNFKMIRAAGATGDADVRVAYYG